MDARLEKLFNEIEVQRKTLLVSLSNHSDEDLNKHRKDKWSINQIISHLITAERLSVQYLGKKILAVNDVEDSGIAEEVKMMLLTLSQRLPFKFKAPKVVVEHTTNEKNISNLITQWDNTRLELRSILERIEGGHVNRKIYKHVRAGMLNVQHALKFFGDHVAHHAPQVKYVLKQK